MKLERELDQTGPASLRDFTESGVKTISVGIQELSVIESVEELSAEFQQFGLGECGSLQKRDVPIVDARSAQCVASQVTEGCD